MLVLAHVLEAPEVRAWYRARSQLGAYIIVDSPVVEFGPPMEFDKVLDLALDIGASEVLTPDWFEEADKTINEAVEACKKVGPAGYTGNIMVSPQGLSVEEWMACAQVVLHLPIHTIGISYRFLKLFKSRLYAISRIRPYLHGCSVHLLGSSLNPLDEMAEALTMPYVRGVDSAVAAIFTKYGITWRPGLSRPPRDLDFVNDEYSGPLLERNLEAWRRSCCNGPKSTN